MSQTSRFAVLLFTIGTLCVSSDARAQGDDCFEFCDAPPPCYREPENPDCNPACTCRSPDYPECDPECRPGELGCDPDPTCTSNPCWSEFGIDICREPPPACEPSAAPPFRFEDNMDGAADGQIVALNPGAAGCGTLRVDRTGYYTIFDTELSESCSDQQDETGYLTIVNSCNAEGWASERNADDRFLVFDSDNSPPCSSDTECGDGEVCREGNSHGRCCVPVDPVFMGTFLLVEGEANRICINHWCPEWSAEFAAGRDYGFVVDGCEGINSIHFKIAATAIACEDESSLQPCSFGCTGGACLPDPCDAIDCPAYCMNGVCQDANPCRDLSCDHGCVRGLCLQSRHARGPDRDGDGFSDVADCDDSNEQAHPDHRELCGNRIDDNCDGRIDESSCIGDGEESDAGPTSDTADGADAGDRVSPPLSSGCGCRISDVRGAPVSLVLIVMGLALGRRRRR
ncbi:MAG: MYXO-CTERM domain-containing protein [Polyangiales bacterium]|jgi:MYXO-CTERM domain-containing protein